MTTDERIAQFENMAKADPDNEMAHFSLGNAYLQAGRAAEAAEALARCIELNPDMSKAYQLAGDAMIKAGWSDRAVLTLNQGYEVAAKRGDLMPKKAIEELLDSIGREPPTLSMDVATQLREMQDSGAFTCSATGRAGTQLEQPPFRGPIGVWIHENISEQTWQEWIGQGTKVINELRLDFSREEDQATYDRHMYEFLGMDDALLEKLTAGA